MTGVFELLESAACSKANLIPVLPQIVKAIKQALNTRDPGVVYATLKVRSVSRLRPSLKQNLFTLRVIVDIGNATAGSVR